MSKILNKNEQFVSLNKDNSFACKHTFIAAKHRRRFDTTRGPCSLHLYLPAIVPFPLLDPEKDLQTLLLQIVRHHIRLLHRQSLHHLKLLLENGRLVPRACFSQVALPPGRMRRMCSRAPRFHHQRPETAWQQNMDRLCSVPIVWFRLGPQHR